MQRRRPGRLPSFLRLDGTPARVLVIVTAFALLNAERVGATSHPVAPTMETSEPLVRITGHVLPALARAQNAPDATPPVDTPMTLTIVLARSDQTGFERYLHD